MGDEKKIPMLFIKNQYLNNTKIARIISTKQIAIGENKRNLKISFKKNINNIVTLWTDPDVQSPQIITQFDAAVMDAAYTILNNGYTMFTVEWVSKVLSGNMKQKVTKNKRIAIINSIEKLRGIHIRIDAKKEFNARKDAKGKDGIFEGRLLPIDKFDAFHEVNGKKAEAYQFLEKPAIYSYAEAIHQIIDVPVAFFETQELFRDTDMAILVKRYVIKRIKQIIRESNKLNSRKISFEWIDSNGETRGMYAELGLEPDHSEKWKKKTKPSINKIVRNTLKFLEEQNVICNYEAYRAHGTKNPASQVMGYEIVLQSPLRKNGGEAKELKRGR